MTGFPSKLGEEFEQRALHNGVGFPFQARMLAHVVDLVNDPQTDIARLAALIGWNPLLARMIALRASDFYDLPGRVSNVNMALALLGTGPLRDTLKRAVASGAHRHMTYSFHYCEELWNHSLTCAVVAKAIATEMRCVDPERAFIAGLAHDVGFLFLGNELPSVEASRSSAWEATSDVGRFKAFIPPAMHEEAGSWMLKRWDNLPPDVTEAVRHHHSPMKADRYRQLAAVVHVADALCHYTFGGPMGKTQSGVHVDPRALELLGMHEPSDSTQQTINSLTARIRRSAPALTLKVRVLQQRLFETFEELSERERFLLALHYYEGISFKSIAGILGIPADEVTQHHAGAFRQFEKVLAEVGEVL